MTVDRDDGDRPLQQTEYEQWAAEQDDADEINRLLDEASNDDR